MSIANIINAYLHILSAGDLPQFVLDLFLGISEVNAKLLDTTFDLK